jgi:tetratricopeptide (TPR) repeat protein
MAQPHDQTRPATPADKLSDAVELAKAGRKAEACNALRQIVARQPVNQAAWLWLSAVAANQAEAEAALAQARHINPAHLSMPQAERWLAQRFSVQPVTLPGQATILPPPAHLAQEFTQPARAITQPMPSPSASSPAQSPPTKVQPASSAPIESKTGEVLKTSQVFISRFQPRVINWLALGLVGAAILVGLVVLLLGLVLEVNATAPAASPIAAIEPRHVALEQAWAKHNWVEAIAILEAMQRDAPNSPALKEQLAQAYWQKGLALRHKGFIEEAIPLFKESLQLKPEQLAVQQELQLATRYLAGVEHYQVGRWSQAITAFEAVQTTDSDYIHLTDLLYSAYYNHALARQAGHNLLDARQTLAKAIALRPDLPEPRRQMAEIEFALAPQTPLVTPTPIITNNQLILVGIAEQRMHVYQGNELVFDFIVSTGEPGRDTAIGDFEILDKIDVAYASTWNLDMPYWMGIYWAGPLQNGIHALPIVKHTGYKLWDGYLGQRVSYGCVILGDEDAATLYQWAKIGAKVKILPSLAYWSPESD